LCRRRDQVPDDREPGWLRRRHAQKAAVDGFFPSAELDALYAKVERLLKPATVPPARPRKGPAPQPRPDQETAAELEQDLPGLEADVANASNRAAKQFADANLKRTRERLAALKTAGRVAP